MKLDVSKPVTTRDGRPARIICTDFKNDNSNDRYIVALITKADGYEVVHKYKQNGKIINRNYDYLDLVNPKAKKTGWVNVCQSGSALWCFGPVYNTMAEALKAPTSTRIATIPIEWEE